MSEQMNLRALMSAARRGGSGTGLRAALHSGAALAAVAISASGTASAGPDACVIAGVGAYLCSGDQSDGVAAGVDFPAFLTTLTVNGLTQDITPPGGAAGIVYESIPGTDIFFTVDTGDFQIETQGVLANGVAVLGDNYNDISLNIAADILTSLGFSEGVSLHMNATGEVAVDFSGAITTVNEFSDGIAISTNNSSGDVVLSSVADISTSGNVSRGISVGNALDGSVLVDSAGTITTSGEGATGLLVREDGIENASISWQGAITTVGDGSSGIDAQETDDGNVSLVNQGEITTSGTGSNGVFISEEGAGGVSLINQGDVSTNGMDAVGIAVAENDGGDVSVASAGSVSTAGANAHGFFVEKDGNGLIDFTSTGNISVEGDAAAGIRIVKNGSGVVGVTAQGAISTSGANGDGVFLTDTGAGGVSVAVNGTLEMTGSSSDGVSLIEDNSGDAVAEVVGDITTAGSVSYGVSILEFGDGDAMVTHQGNISINTGAGIRVSEFGQGDVIVASEGDITGAGGGAVGINAAGRDGGDLRITHVGDIASPAGAILAGNTSAGNITVEATGNFSISDGFADAVAGIRSGAVGNVDIILNGDVSTLGEESRGIRIFNNGGDSRVEGGGSVSTQGRESAGIEVATALGNAAVAYDGDVSTRGDESQGILIDVDNGSVVATVIGAVSTEGAQSAGFEVATTLGNAIVAYGGDLSTTGELAPGLLVAGDEGLTDLDISGAITTEGDMSSGVSTFIGGAGAIGVTGAGTIMASGLASHGVEAVIGAAGAISIAYDGEIRASGVDAHAVLVNGPGMNTVSLNGGGMVQGGSGSGAGVMAASPAGATTTINNGAGLSALSGLAIRGGAGDETVNNSGTVIGDILLGSGANAFNNLPSGALYSSSAVTLGAGGVLTNDGTVNPGGAGAAQATVLDGDYVQTAGGVFSIDVGAGGDFLEVSGAADLAGVVEASLSGLGARSQEITILSAAGGVADNGLSLQLSGGLDNSFLFDVELLTPNPNDIVLAIDFGIPTAGLNPNQANIADNLLDGAVAGDGVLPVLNGLVTGVASVAELQGALDQLSPEIYLNTEKATLFAAAAFADSLFECGRPGSARAAVAEDYCVWLHAEARTLDEETTTQNIGFDEDVAVISGGVQYALTSDLALGVGVNYESGSLEAGGHAEASVDRVAGGVSAHYRPGPVSLSGVAFAGTSNHGDVRRSIAFGDFVGVASGEQDIFFAGAALRAAYRFERGRLYFNPVADLAYSYLDADDVIESGVDAACLDIEGGSDGALSMSSALEIGAELALPSGLAFRPFVKPGVSFITGKDATLRAAFASNPGGVGSFLIRNELEDVYVDIEAGAALFGAYGVSARLSYIGRFATDTAQQGVVFRASYQF